ncbi:hypothetical protein [Gordonia crocea]|uniref:Uncharacterized protein n=1 Tax=Gordonia crocea TaxID=589162 RepID=A0A7I9UYD1_9ACTN|nr:hypothetical protein [Gordonia crocea]GED97821.1 hypothetical protein nbrc107697_18600 [Gordonia crocea]
MGLGGAGIGIIVVVALFGGIPALVAAGVVYWLRSVERSSPAVAPERGLGTWTAAAVSVLAGVALWFAWLTWGGYYTDASGQTQGPYRPWQVVACALSVGAVTGILGWFTRWRLSGPLVAAIGVVLGFSTVWAVDAGTHDSTGLWGVGYLFLLVGGGIALGLVAVVVVAIRASVAKRRAGLSYPGRS